MADFARPALSKRTSSVMAKDEAMALELSLSKPGQNDPKHPSTFQLTRTVSVVEAKRDCSRLPTDVVVKVHGTGVRPSYLQPWQVQAQKTWTGTGFTLPRKRIMTNAHVVEDATVLQVTKQGDPKKFHAKLECVAHDLDLALMIVEDASFWENLSHAEFSQQIPELYSEVKAVGFPVGGVTVCVTKGIVARIDAQIYVHPQILGVGISSNNDALTILQIDAAINPGNSGGPAFDKYGLVVGVASSGLPDQQNVGYIIPSFIAMMFLQEVESTGKWSGISESGISAVSLENDSMREYLSLGENKGVLVNDVAPLGALYGKLKEGDVITHIDGLDVTNEGDVPFTLGEQKVFLAMDSVTTQKSKGEITKYGIIRDGEQIQLTVALHPIPALAPRFHGYDSNPEYLLIGGVVFTQGTVPLFDEWRRAPRRPHINPDVWKALDAYKEDKDHELVVVLTILTHEVNIGYNQSGILHSFNERKVKNLAQLAQRYGEVMRGGSPSNKDRFLRFYIGKDEKNARGKDASSERRQPEIVLERSKIAEADKAICAINHIPAVASPAMLVHLTQGAQSLEQHSKKNAGEGIPTLEKLRKELKAANLIDSDGFIDKDDLAQYFSKVSGGSIGLTDVEQLILSACPSDSKMVSFKKFIDFLHE